MQEYIDTVEKIIRKIQSLTIATVTDKGEPWNTPVFSAYDQNLCFYWSSSPKSVHSQNIDRDGKVFLVVYESVVKQGTGWGFYMQAEAKSANTVETQEGLELLGKRREKPFKNTETFDRNGPQKIYKITPKKIWINNAKQDDYGEFIEDYRIEIDLNDLKSRFAK